jgi:DNA-binding NtrC family response regulator
MHLMPEKASPSLRVLIVDDERDHADVMSEALQRQGYNTRVAYNLADAKSLLDEGRFDVIVTDLMMDGRREGMELLQLSQKLEPPPPVILVTAINDVPTSKQAMNEGAYDYIIKPLDLDEFRAQVARASERSLLQKQNEVLESRLVETSGFEGIIGRSAGIQHVLRVARQVAASDIPVLILGESGTGKELIARAIHENSRRRKARFVAINSAGFPEAMLEGELFGHVRGAFTGALTDREGRFEHANHGSLFMDEIGDMPLSMQAKLLRVLENGEVVRVGSNDPKKVDVRIVSATNRNLEEMIGEKKFREDLYFRIKGVTVTIPPLRERKEDIPLLLYYFVKQAAEKYGRNLEGIAPDAQQALMGYHWPGNVRQLRNAADNMVVMAGGKRITAQDLPEDIRPSRKTIATTSTATDIIDAEVVRQSVPLLESTAFDEMPDTRIASHVPDANVIATEDASGRLLSLEELERVQIERALRITEGNREQAAKMLGIGERTLYRKIKEYGL